MGGDSMLSQKQWNGGCFEAVPELPLGLDNGDPTGLVDGWERGPDDAVADASHLSRLVWAENQLHAHDRNSQSSMI